MINNLLELKIIAEKGITSIPIEGLDKAVAWLIENLSVFGYIAIGIIFFTLLLKIIPLPLDIISRASTKRNALRMEKMRPELERLQKQYANNKELYQKKMMALYKKEGYSTFAACLPTIFTLVFFIIVINAFSKYSSYANLEIYNNMAKSYNNSVYVQLSDLRYNVEDVTIIDKENGIVKINDLSDSQIETITTNAQDVAALTYKDNIKKYKFLWVKNIWISDLPWKKSFTSWDKSLFTYRKGCGSQVLENSSLYQEDNFNLITGSSLLDTEKNAPNGYLILVVLSIGIMLVSQLIVTKTQKTQMELQSVDGQNGTAAQTSKMMMWMMPIMFGFFAFMYSAAFSLYMIVSSLISTLSTLLINYFVEKKFKKLAEKEAEDSYNARYGHLLKNKDKKKE